MEPNADIVTQALHRLLTPLARILVRAGVAFEAFGEVAKRAYVDAAREDLQSAAQRPTAARIAVLTGLSRKEVARIQKQPAAATESVIDASLNRAARVVAGWVRDADFHGDDGNPADLPLDGDSGFAGLVRRYSGDMPVRAVLEELVRSGAADLTDADRVRLRARSFVPSADTARKLQILGTDSRDLIATIDHNLRHPPAQARFQRKTVYDNVPREFAGAFREQVTTRGQDLIEEFDRWLAERDRDRTPGVGGSGRVRLGVGMYLIEEELDPASPPDGEQE